MYSLVVVGINMVKYQIGFPKRFCWVGPNGGDLGFIV